MPYLRLLVGSRRALKQISLASHSRCNHSASPRIVQTDEFGVPLTATWSVNELLSSYPSPKVSSKTLRKLYDLSALVPPEEGTQAHAKITKDVEEMIRLVEAVKFVNTEGVVVAGRGEGEDMDRKLYGNPNQRSEEEYGPALLKHASRVVEGSYVVETDRSRKPLQ